MFRKTLSDCIPNKSGWYEKYDLRRVGVSADNSVACPDSCSQTSKVMPDAVCLLKTAPHYQYHYTADIISRSSRGM